MNTNAILRLQKGAIFSCFLMWISVTNAAVIYVNPSAAGSNNGTSWANAYVSLSTALLNANSGDEIWVKAGVYKPTNQVDINGSGGSDAREATFQVPVGVSLYGGFLGTETLREERNWMINNTILSGDIDNNDVNDDGNFIAENTSLIVGNNAYHVLYTINADAATLIDGFIVTAGSASSSDPVTDPNQDGGAWYIKLNAPAYTSSPSIINTTFQGNYAGSEGGALYFTNAPAGGTVFSLIQNCKFRYNKSNFAGGAVNLGSFSAGNYQPHILYCEFSNNEAFRRGGAIYLVGDHSIIDTSVFRNNKVTAVSPDASTLPGSGGGVVMTSSNATFRQCLFDGNTTTGNPTGAFEGGGGGAVYMSTNEIQTTSLGASEPEFINCGFYSNTASGNTAAWGGAAVHLSDGGKLRPKYINCVFYGNHAQNDGGAIANFTRVISVADGFVPELGPGFTNCTFTSNNAGRGGAIFNDGFVFNSSEVLQARIENSLLWGNTASVSGPEIFSNGGNNIVAYSLIQGSGGSGGGWNSSIGTDGGNNLDADPDFVNAGDPFGPDALAATGDDGLLLMNSSPALNTGNNSATGLAGITQDYKKDSRIQGSNVDMGAYEQAGIVIPHIDVYWLDEWRDLKPGCLSCPWSFLLPERLFQQFVWNGPAQLIVDGNTATVKGHIINLYNKGMGFDVNLKLVNKQDWNSWSAKGRTYAAYTPTAISTAKKNHTEWTFWELSSESSLTGIGDLKGQLKLSNFPPNYKIGFQFGEGANGWDADQGLSGLFYYSGKLSYKGKNINAKGLGSMNVDASLCTENCTPLLFDKFAFMQQDHLQLPGVEDKKDLSIFPVPARNQLTILLNNSASGLYTLKFYNSAGQLQKHMTKALTQGNNIIAVSDLRPGIYILQLTSFTGEVYNKKIIIE